MLESADSELELADSTADSAANPLRNGLKVRAFILDQMENHYSSLLFF